MRHSLLLSALLASALAVLPGRGDASEEPPAPPGARLSGIVYEDENENGLYDERELPAIGVIVDLLDEDARFVERTLTGEDGVYHFEDLSPGVYFLRFEFTPGYGVRSRGIEIGPKPTGGKALVASGKQPIPTGKQVLEHRFYDDGTDGWVFVPVPVVYPWSNYSFTRLQLVNPANFKGEEVSPFTP